MISDHFEMPSTHWLSDDKDLGFIGDNHLRSATSEDSKEKIGAKQKATFSFKYLFRYLFAQVGDPPAVLHAVHRFRMKSM